MDNDQINRNLLRQINKFLTDETIRNHPQVADFISVVNNTYLNYEKDAELFEQSTKLNDKEYSEINAKLKSELSQKEVFQKKIIDSIYKISGEKIQLEDSEDIAKLIKLLNNQIEIKAIHQEQLAAAKVIAEKANDAKSDFLSIMSHEIRTPLNAIIGLIYIMEKENTLESFQENLDALKHSSNNLFHLINNVLDFNKIEAGKIDIESIPFNFQDLILKIVKSLELKASENLTKIEVVIDDDFCQHLISDPLRLSQIVTNLLSNAIKFTKNGTVKIVIKQLEISEGISSFNVAVLDTGIGIDLLKFNQIFEKFSQAETKTSRQFGGTGLGLVITKKLLNLLDSDIKLESELNKGSKFSFTLRLPIDTNHIENTLDFYGGDYQEKIMPEFRILLVEDNIINVKIAQKIISQWDVSIDVAENGQVAIEKHASNSYDLILMDLSMPIMDGYEATKIIRIQDKKTPIIALTASASSGYLERSMGIGINDYVIKPFSPKELNMKLFKYYSS
uniref:response regulator n=2 Tax=Flavobacterium sp. TaxID=239 RepID=UPI00404B47CD